MSCTPTSTRLCSDESCEVCLQRSFASHTMAASWSPKNILKPREVMRGSEKKILFDCVDCKHEFEKQLYSIKQKSGCPYCANQKLCNNDLCDICFNKTCASHAMAEAWSSKNTASAREMFLQSNKKIIFNCLTCRHEYETTPNHYFTRNGSCAYCDNKKLCENEECDDCYNKSFASHKHAVCWSVKNDCEPRDIFKGSNKRCYFNCNKCNLDFETYLYNVLTGYWCPYCKNKTEGKLLEFIKDKFADYKTQLRFDWCRYSKTRNIMPFDFGLLKNKILIELDGRQHFEQIAKWDSHELTQLKDIEKINYAITKGYSIIHIYQEEVWNDSYNWKKLLDKAIELLIWGSEPQVLFLSRADVYQKHISQLPNDTSFKVMHPSVIE